MPKKIYKTHRKLYMPAALFRWSWRLQVEKRLWCGCNLLNLLNFQERLPSSTCRDPYVEISSTLKKWTVFSSILVFIHFKLILESCTTSGVYLEPHQTSMMKVLAVVFSQKHSILDIWQGSKYSFLASLFNIFSVSLFGYLNEYTKTVFLLKVCWFFDHVT